MTDKEWERIASPQVPFPPPPPPLLAPQHPQEPATSNKWQRCHSQLRPPPDFLHKSQFEEEVCEPRANVLPFCPRPSSHIVPVLNEGQHSPFAMEKMQRLRLSKVKQQTCDLDVNTGSQALLKQIQQGVKLKPVSPEAFQNFCAQMQEVMGRNCNFIESLFSKKWSLFLFLRYFRITKQIKVTKANVLVWIQVGHLQHTDVTDKVWGRASPAAAPLHCQEAEASKEWRMSSSPPWPPPPDFLPNGPAGESGGGTLLHDHLSHPAPPSPIRPVLNEGRCPPLALERDRRGVKLRKVEQQSCELDSNIARQTLLEEIQRGIKLKPVSSDTVLKSQLAFLC